MKRFLCITAAALLSVVAIAASAQTAPPVNETGQGCSMRQGVAWDGGISASVTNPGVWSSHWCLGADRKYHLRINAATAANAIAMGSDWMRVQNASDHNAALTAFMTKYPAANVSVNDPTLLPIWQPNLAQIVAARPADPAPPPVQAFVVAGNGSVSGIPRKTRPAFKVVNGLRGAQSGVAQVGDACRPDLAIVIEGADAFMPFGAAASQALITLCTPKP